MQWALRQRGWRALLIKMALLAVLWLAVAFVFATEIYLTAPSGPIRVSWRNAAASAFRDWFPWILLSPVAVLLAGKFPFNRQTWRRSLVMHLAAPFLFTAAYEGLLLLTYPTPFVVTTSGIGGGIGVFSTPGADPSGLALVVSADGFGPRPGAPFPAGSNAAVIAVPPSAGSNVVFVTAMTAPSSFDGPIPPPPGRWVQLLHMAMLRLQFTVPIYFCIVCVCWVINHFQESSQQERRTLELETRLTQANLQTLKMQLQPHFLFNTLNTISSLVHEDPKVADDMISSLSQFLRTTLDVSSKNEIPLRQELEFLDRYLEIQQARFGNRLRTDRELDSAALDALVPPLILQPLAENAIRYGIEPRESGGTLTIQALRDGDILRLEISDDGEGFSGSQLLRAGNGVGLSNTKARLEALYGGEHQFRIAANQPRGASVKIQIPFRHSHPDSHHET